MGDRGNIAVIGRDTRDQVWFYGHWSGHRMPAVLQQAVREGRGRWQDPSYFARIVFCRLLPPDDRYFEETSYGISTVIGDNEHPIMVADCVKQQVYTIAEKQLKNGQVPADFKPKEVWTFEEYATLEKLPWGDMESQLSEHRYFRRMECASEDRRFRLARQICKALNGKESPDELTAKLQTQIEWWQTAKEDPHGIANAVIASLVSVQNALRDATTQKEGAK